MTRKKEKRVNLPEVCRQVRSHLEETMPEMESAFVVIGEQLEKMDQCSRSLTTQCGELLQLASGSQEGSALLREALEVLRTPLEYIDYCMGEHERLLSLLGQCESQTKGMLSIGGRMHDAIAPLTFMSVLFKIESAYLPVDMRETFTTVTVEVERLHKLVDETFAQNAQQLEFAYKTLSSVRAHLEADFQKQTKHVAEKRKHIDSAILTLDEQLSRNNERDSRLHQHSKLLSDEVAKVVMGVQFQDIVKQKCDHISAALGGDGGKVSNQQIHLQIHQLKSVETDFEQGTSSIQNGLGRIRDLTDQLNQSSVSLESFESMTAAVDGMVQSLLDTLADVHEIIGMVHDLAEQGNTAVQPANGIARNLTSAINELSINMRLIALNAQVRSVQGGQGTGLELLAARTAEISDEINDISTQVSDDLSHLHSAIDQMLRTFAEFLERGKDQNERLQAARGETEKHLHALRDRALTSVQLIGESAMKMQSSVEDVNGAVDVLPALNARLKGAREKLNEVQPELSIEAADSKHLSSLTDRYTMASERKVHDALVASMVTGQGAPKTNGTTANSAPEMFSDQSEVPTQNTQATTTSAASDGVELF